MKTAAVIVLYNPDKEVIKNIDSYYKQVNYIYAVDNSDSEDLNFREMLNKYTNLKYLRQSGNMGIARALNLGAEAAITDGYTHLLTMDQDSFAPENLVGKLHEAGSVFPNAGIISPLHGNRFSTQKTSGQKYEEVLVVKTSGNLLSLQAFIQIGRFNEDFFIDYVDIEYCMRLNKAGLKVIQVNDLILMHNEADLTRRKFLFKDVYPYNHSPLRFYYKTRNRFYLRENFKKDFPDYFNIEFTLFVNNLIKVILYESDKFLKFKMLIRGYFDYQKGIKGKFTP